jgi:5-methylcytosine-specific restriction endonuclease McrA
VIGHRGWHTKQSKAIWKRDLGICIYCGKPAQVIDHVVPYSRGGKTRLDNGVCCCNNCNYEKRDKLIESFLIKGISYLMKLGYNMDWVDNLN